MHGCAKEPFPSETFDWRTYRDCMCFFLNELHSDARLNRLLLCVGCAMRAASTNQWARLVKVIDDKFVRCQMASCCSFAKHARPIDRSLDARTPAVHARCMSVRVRIRALGKALPSTSESIIHLMRALPSKAFLYA